MLGRLLPILALAAIAVAYLEPGLVRGKLLVGGDLLFYTYPRQELIGARLAAGELPGWNACASAPLFGPRAGGVVYPPNGLYALLPVPRAAALFAALHVLLAAEGVRRLLRERAGLSGAGAAAGGLVYALGGFLTAMVERVPTHVSGAWLPWALLAGHRLAASPPPSRGAALGALALGMMLLACQPQGAALGAGLLVLPCLLAPRDARPRALGWAAAAVLVAGLAGAPTLLSVRAEARETDRYMSESPGEVDPAQAERWGLRPAPLLLDLVLPDAAGLSRRADYGYWGLGLWGGDRYPFCGMWVGTLGLVALLFAIPRGPDPGHVRRLGLGLVLLGVALAALDPGRLAGMRYAAKFLVLSALGLALLVAVGFERLRRLPGPPRALLPVGSVLAAAGLLLGAQGSDGGPLVLSLGEATEALLEWSDPAHVDGTAARAALAAALLRAGVVLLLAASAWGVSARLGGSRSHALAALLLGVLAFDLLRVAGPANRWFAGDPAAPLAAPRWVEVVRRLEPGPVPPRVWSRSRPGELELPAFEPPPPGSIATLADLADRLRMNVMDGSSGFLHRLRVIEPFETVTPRARRLLVDSGAFRALPLDRRAALLDGARVMVRRSEWERLSPAERQALGALGSADPQVNLFRVATCPPWACLVERAREVQDLPAAVVAACAPERDPRHEVVLGPELAPAPALAPVPGEPPGEVRALAFEPERIELEVAARRPAWLVLREAWSADWSATCDGAPVPIARADVLFRAIPVPAGPSRVELRWAPAWRWPALGLSALGWAGVIGAAVRARRRRGEPGRG